MDNRVEDLINRLIDTAFLEDIGDGDHTSLSCIPTDLPGSAQLLVKSEGVLAGIGIARKVFHRFDPELVMEVYLDDGTWVKPGDVAFKITGSRLSILQTERLVLNIMQRMSGIATETHKYVEKIKDYPTKILDTRKTTPGMRVLDKEAVRLGGGVNHRMGLYDMIMIKDNHADFAGGIRPAITNVQAYLKTNKLNLAIEVEARSIDEIKEIMEVGGIQRIMLDNFTIAQTRNAVQLINHQYETESSGGITLATLVDYAACGVDFISIGAITHQVKSLDLSLKAI
ncbi:MAG: carboxylating nicotinate-nucleotide diphosphorylase [Bacteroidales bacterium]|nr:carboxylating nicotinate-nucleotide diphosphorylase [Bacteroidales bacterium]